MGLKRVKQKETHFYMYFNISSIGEDKKVLKVVILAKENTSMLRVTTGNVDVKRWCVKLGRSPEEYLEQLCEAVRTDDESVAVFEVQGEHLIWKQYFPEKEIYGKKGKFKMEKVKYEDAVEMMLAGVTADLQESSSQIHQLNQQSHDNIKRLDEALELASRSVQMKEDLERDVYSKCAALVNAKKLRIHQLRSTHPSSSAAGRTSCLTRANDEVARASSPAKKARVREAAADDSDGYNSDTDVDDPDEDMDTDDERAVSVSPSKQKVMPSTSSNKRNDEQATDKTKVSLEDSQELFNASLDAELFPSSTSAAQRKVDAARPPVQSSPQSPPQLTRSSAAESVQSPGLSQTKCDYEDDTQMSILNSLF